MGKTMTDEIKRALHSVTCGLHDVRAARAGATAAEMLARQEARPAIFADHTWREVWVAQQTKRRLSQRRKIWSRWQ